MLLWRRLLGIFAVTVLGVLVEMVYLYLSKTGTTPGFRVQLKPNIDLST